MHKLFRNKKGQLSGSNVLVAVVVGPVLAVIALVIFAQVIAALFPEFVFALENLTAAGIPLGGLLSPTGVAGLLFGAIVVIGVILLILKVGGTIPGAKGGRR